MFAFPFPHTASKSTRLIFSSAMISLLIGIGVRDKPRSSHCTVIVGVVLGVEVGSGVDVNVAVGVEVLVAKGVQVMMLVGVISVVSGGFSRQAAKKKHNNKHVIKNFLMMCSFMAALTLNHF